jgi:hypothetical protein
MRHHLPYDDTFKAAIVNRVLMGETPTVISRKEDINEKTIRKWVKDSPSAIVASPVITSHSGKVVMVIPDMHHPFCHPHALPFLKAAKAKYQPDQFVCLGDEVDFHALSRYDHDPNGLSPGGELKAAIEELIPFYLEFPKMLVCESNHTVRGHKKAFASGIPSAFLAHISTVLNAPDGWKWANHWNIDGVRYFHGDAGRSGQYAHIQYLKAFKQSLVIGHVHSFAGVAWEGDKFAVNSGCLISEDKYAFAYARNMAIRPSLGCSIVVNGKSAQFIPMLTDENGNWTGEI